jgi:DNA repair exonuclease SbcCD ATPase subunit
LDEECDQLHEKNGDLNLELQKFQEELQQAREEIQFLKEKLTNQPTVTEGIVERNAQIQELEKRNHELRVKISEVRQKAADKERELTRRIDCLQLRVKKLSESGGELSNLEEIRDRILRELLLGKSKVSRNDLKFRHYEAAISKFISLYIEFVKRPEVDS